MIINCCDIRTVVSKLLVVLSRVCLKIVCRDEMHVC